MIWVFYHHPEETLGLIRPVLSRRGIAFQEIHLYRGEKIPQDDQKIKSLIVMGGPMNVDEVETYSFLSPEVETIKRFIETDRLVLGICLGAQLIAKALGAKVYPNAFREVGWHSVEFLSEAKTDLLFKHFPDSEVVFHWHGDTFDLPEGAVHLAKTSKCKHQAFRWGKKVYGFQFHIEVTPEMASKWCLLPDSEDYARGAGENTSLITASSEKHFRNLKPLAEKALEEFLNLI